MNHSEIARNIGCSRTTVINILKTADEIGFIWDGIYTDAEIYRQFHLKKRIHQKEEYYIELGAYVKLIPKQKIASIWRKYIDSTNELHYSKSAFYASVKEKMKILKINQYKNGVTVSALSCCNGFLVVIRLLFSEYIFCDFLSEKKTRSWINYFNTTIKKIGGIPECLIISGHIPKKWNHEMEKLCDFYQIKLETKKSDDKIKKLFEQVLLSLSDGMDIIASTTRVERENNLQKVPGCNELKIENLYEYEVNQFGILRSHYQMIEENIKYVGVDFHVKVEGVYYSVPFEYRHKKVMTKSYDDKVEIWADGEIVAQHDKSDVLGQYITNPIHLPDFEDIPWSETSGLKLRDTARKIGKNTFKVIHKILSSEKFECYGYRRCNHILDLAHITSPERLEAACEIAIKNNEIDSKKIRLFCEERQ